MNERPTEQESQDRGQRISDVASVLRSIDVNSPNAAQNRDRMIDANGRTINYEDKQF